MRKVKVFMVVSLLSILSLLLFTGCENVSSLHMDEDKCAEVALEYLEDKYQTEFEVLDSGEKYKYIGTAGYAEVIVTDKLEDNENRYTVTVYPDGLLDENKDGYYDSYKVISDDYMGYLLYDYVKDEIDKLLMDVGLTKFISSVGIQERGDVPGFLGFSADFPVLREADFSFNNVLDNYRISIHCWLKIPESEKSEMLQDSIINIMKPFISDDIITFSMEVYDEEVYREIEELRKNNIGYNGKGNERISFSVKEEDKNESK